MIRRVDHGTRAVGDYERIESDGTKGRLKMQLEQLRESAPSWRTFVLLDLGIPHLSAHL